MNRNREKDTEAAEIFCIITALAICVLSILFLFDFLQNHWFLNFILGLGVLLHIAVWLLSLVRRRHVVSIVSAMFAVFYAGGLIYFNFL